MSQRVLIVGTGPSGLAALKEMHEAGLDAIAVDSRPSFGGVFALDSGVTYEDLHLTISNLFMAFSDFPPADVHKGVKYWSQAEYYAYLVSYVEHFQLEPHMQLKTTVHGAHFNHETAQWEVKLSNESDTPASVVDVQYFDKMIVATGANHTPKLPDELSEFKGDVIHSADYHSAKQLNGKNVLVVGMGEGAADVASSATTTADSVTVWGRRFPDCAPRFIEPYLHDSSYNEAEHIDNHHKPNGMLENLTITRIVRNLPLGIWSMALHGLTGDMQARHGPNSMQGMGQAFTSRAWSADYFSSDTSMVPTKSGITLTAAANGLLDIVIAEKATIKDKTVSFQGAQLFGASGDGAAAVPTHITDHRAEFDVIVSCTGFELDFDWISFSDPDNALQANPRTWFKHCFPAGMGDYLAFVGFARPHSGGIPQCSEILSRYIAQLHLGNLSLPTDYANIALLDGDGERECFNLTPDYNALVDYLAFMMSVAKLIGCEPRTVPPLSRPLDAVKYWTFPQWPCFFRTRGVGAKPETTEAVLTNFKPFDSLAPMPLLALQIVCTLFMPFVNAFALITNTLFPRRVGQGLPRFYKWRSSKINFLYHNSLTAYDFKIVFTQWLATVMIIGRAVGLGLYAGSTKLIQRFQQQPVLPSKSISQQTPPNATDAISAKISMNANDKSDDIAVSNEPVRPDNQDAVSASRRTPETIE